MWIFLLLRSLALSLSFFLLQCMFLINYYELFECRIIITKSFRLFSVWLCRTTFARAHQSIHPHRRHVVSVGLSLSLSLFFSSHIIDWNVTLLLCKDTRRMSTWTTSTANERELIMSISIHSSISHSLTQLIRLKRS